MQKNQRKNLGQIPKFDPTQVALTHNWPQKSPDCAGWSTSNTTKNLVELGLSDRVYLTWFWSSIRISEMLLFFRAPNSWILTLPLCYSIIRTSRSGSFHYGRAHDKYIDKHMQDTNCTKQLNIAHLVQVSTHLVTIYTADQMFSWNERGQHVAGWKLYIWPKVLFHMELIRLGEKTSANLSPRAYTCDCLFCY